MLVCHRTIEIVPNHLFFALPPFQGVANVATGSSADRRSSRESWRIPDQILRARKLVGKPVRIVNNHAPSTGRANKPAAVRSAPGGWKAVESHCSSSNGVPEECDNQYDLDECEAIRRSALGELKLPKAHPPASKPWAFVDCRKPTDLLHEEISYSVEFKCWDAFEDVAARCAGGWKSKLSALEDSRDLYFIEYSFLLPFEDWEEFKKWTFQPKHAIVTDAGSVFSALGDVESYLNESVSGDAAGSSETDRKNSRSRGRRSSQHKTPWEVRCYNEVYQEESLADPQPMKPNCHFYQKDRVDKAGVGRSKPIVNIELEWLFKPLLYEEEDTGRSATGVANFYNDRYGKREQVEPRRRARLGPPWFCRSIAETITAALHSRSGCAGLYVHNEAVFLRVSVNEDEATRLEAVAAGQEGPKDKNWEWRQGRARKENGSGNQRSREFLLEVEVSRVFKVDDEVNTCHGVLALLLFGREAKDRSRKLEMAYRILSKLHRQRRSREVEGSERTWDALNGGEDGGKGPDDVGEAYGEGSTPPGGNGDQQGSTPMEMDFEELERVDGLLDKEEQLFDQGSVYDQTELIYRLLKDYECVMAEGGSGMVLEGRVGELRVAVKYWNGLYEEAVEWFMHELDMTEELMEQEPELFGSVLPRVVGIQRHGAFDSVLVTELVGEEVRNDSGRLKVGGVEVAESERGLLLDAGLETLGKLHAAGVVHRDVKCENLRAEREDDANGNVRWRVWLIDLGSSEMSWWDGYRVFDESYMRDCFTADANRCLQE